MIGLENVIIYSGHLHKYNRWGYPQDRVLVITNEHMITFEW